MIPFSCVVSQIIRQYIVSPLAFCFRIAISILPMQQSNLRRWFSMSPTTLRASFWREPFKYRSLSTSAKFELRSIRLRKSIPNDNQSSIFPSKVGKRISGNFVCGMVSRVAVKTTLDDKFLSIANESSKWRFSSDAYSSSSYSYCAVEEDTKLLVFHVSYSVDSIDKRDAHPFKKAASALVACGSAWSMRSSLWSKCWRIRFLFSASISAVGKVWFEFTDSKPSKSLSEASLATAAISIGLARTWSLSDAACTCDARCDASCSSNAAKHKTHFSQHWIFVNCTICPVHYP